MTRYIFKRILSGIFTIWVTTVAVTLLIHLVPGDPVQIMFAQSQSTTPEQIEQIRSQLGLDRPIYEQYFMYMGKVDVLFSFTETLIALAAVAVLGPSLTNAMIAVVLAQFPSTPALPTGRCWWKKTKNTSRPPRPWGPDIFGCCFAT
nr:hypothetical protein [Nodosilinea sp. LEGE 07088]